MKPTSIDDKYSQAAQIAEPRRESAELVVGHVEFFECSAESELGGKGREVAGRDVEYDQSRCDMGKNSAEK